MTTETAPTEPRPTKSDQPPQGFLKRLQGLLTDSATYGLSAVAGRLAQFLLLPITSFYLSPADNGITAMLLIIVLLFGPLSSLGMTNAIFRRFNQATDEATCRIVFSTGLISVLFFTCVNLCIGLLCASWIAEYFVRDANTTGLVRLTLLSAAFNTIGVVPGIALRTRRRVKTAAALNLANVVISITTMLIFLVVLRQGITGWVMGMLSADVLFVFLGLACTWSNFELRFDPVVWKSMFKYGVPFVPHVLQSVAMAQFGQYMVDTMLGKDQSGLYLMASKFALPVGMIVDAIQQAWVPFKFQVHAEEKDPTGSFRSIFTYYIATVSYLWVGAALWGFDVLRLMTESSYHPAAYLVPLLALLRVTQGVYFMIGTGIELSDRTQTYPLISLAGLATVVITAFALIKPMGAQGAALASILAWLAMAWVTYGMAQRRLKIPYEWSTIVCFMVMAAICVAGGFAVQPLQLWVRLCYYVAVSLTYPLLGYLVLARSPAERERIGILMSRLRRRGSTS